MSEYDELYGYRHREPATRMDVDEVRNGVRAVREATRDLSDRANAISRSLDDINRQVNDLIQGAKAAAIAAAVLVVLSWIF